MQVKLLPGVLAFAYLFQDLLGQRLNSRNDLSTFLKKTHFFIDAEVFSTDMFKYFHVFKIHGIVIYITRCVSELFLPRR
jgi:hypothetical protein